MARIGSLNQFEQLLLRSILSLREDAYGVTIQAKAAELAHPEAVLLGVVYFTLDRLEDNGMVASWLADPRPERGERAKQCYRVEAQGERALCESAATAQRTWDAIAEAWGRDWAREWGKRWGREGG